MCTTLIPQNIALLKSRTGYYRKSFAFTGAKLWNALPNNLKEERSLEVFKNELKYVEKLHRNVINLLLGPQGAES